MRTRFFFIILVVLMVVSTATTVMHAIFLKRERLSLIDQQVRGTAVALLDSDLASPANINIRRAERTISEELGENRIGKFFIIRNGNGDVLFDSTTTELLKIPRVPQNPQWVTIEEKGKYIRILNLALPSIPDRTLQVGIVIDQDILSPSYFSTTSVGFIAIALSLGLIVAWLLASFLVRPISVLADFISDSAKEPELGKRLPELPAELQKISGGKGKDRDELAKLIASFARLIERVNRGYDVSRFWSYQMAHELKTPMAVVEALVNEGVQEKRVSEEFASKVLDEVFDVSETISSFLSWAEVESSPAPKRQYVVKVSRVLSSIATRLSQVHGARIQARIDQDFSIYGNLQQLEQLLTNLIQNACTYSPSDSVVTVVSSENKILIKDYGSGMPDAVLAKLGEPFNRGEHVSAAQKSTGLGLAYAHSVCWLHGWKLDFHTGPQGTEITLVFPALPEQVEHSANA